MGKLAKVGKQTQTGHWTRLLGKQGKGVSQEKGVLLELQVTVLAGKSEMWRIL